MTRPILVGVALREDDTIEVRRSTREHLLECPLPVVPRGTLEPNPSAPAGTRVEEHT